MALKKADNPMVVTVDPSAVEQTAEETTSTAPETHAVEPEAPAETPVEPVPETQPDPEPEKAPEPPTPPEPETPPVTVNIPETPPAAPKVDVNPNPIPETNIPTTEQQVRIRMARDHRCTIAMKFYDLKKGQCYNVPPNVKRILNKAGLLSPL